MVTKNHGQRVDGVEEEDGRTPRGHVQELMCEFLWEECGRNNAKPEEQHARIITTSSNVIPHHSHTNYFSRKEVT